MALAGGGRNHAVSDSGTKLYSDLGMKLYSDLEKRHAVTWRRDMQSLGPEDMQWLGEVMDGCCRSLPGAERHGVSVDGVLHVRLGMARTRHTNGAG
jgi:hypothetical protein